MDDTDRVTVTGGTTSSIFPTIPGVFDPSYNGGGNGDVFVLRLNAGARLWTTRPFWAEEA